MKPKFRFKDQLIIEQARQRASQMLDLLDQLEQTQPEVLEKSVAAVTIADLRLLLVCFSELHEMCLDMHSVEASTYTKTQTTH